MKRFLLLTGLSIAVGLGAFGLPMIQAGDDAAVDMATAVPAAVPASVAVVEPRDVTTWRDFSGRLEAVGRVEIRSRVGGAVEAVHFREGALVSEGALLMSIDRAPYAAEVERLEAQHAASEARLAFARSEVDRGRRLTADSTISQRDLETRLNALRQAEADVAAAGAAVKAARLDLGYTEIRAPISGRVGRIDVTPGNLVSAGPGAPVLTTLVSVDPIYAGFDVDEASLTRALDGLPEGQDRAETIGAIPVEMSAGGGAGTLLGSVQMVEPSVDAATGTVRVRAEFANREGRLMPGQFARLRLGQASPEEVLLVSERAVGSDQDKSFVLVVDADHKAAYREVQLGARAEGLRIVDEGLKAGERVILDGLHQVRPGTLVAPEPVAMDAASAAPLRTAATTN